MTPLKWRYTGKNVRMANGHYPTWRYQLIREKENMWTAWLYDSEGRSQRLGQGNFTQARAKCIEHHNHKGY